MKKKILFVLVAIFISMATITSFAGEWKQDNNGWWYQRDNLTFPTNTWEEINDKWYYFNDGGNMLSNTTTPDGYTVNESGEWVESKKVEIPITSKKYIFDKYGDWVDNGKIPEGEYIYYSDTQMRNPIVYGSSSLMSSTFNYIKIFKGDSINSGTYIPVSDAGILDIAGDGVFLVGKDIKAGTYILEKNPGDGKSLNIAKCMIFNSIPSSKDQFAPEKNLSVNLYVQMGKKDSIEVKDGQYVQIINCTAGFVRP